jgi:hypothetical protein
MLVVVILPIPVVVHVQLLLLLVDVVMVSHTIADESSVITEMLAMEMHQLHSVLTHNLSVIVIVKCRPYLLRKINSMDVLICTLFRSLPVTIMDEVLGISLVHDSEDVVRHDTHLSIEMIGSELLQDDRSTKILSLVTEII